MVKATYEFQANFHHSQLILDEQTLYVPEGHQFQAFTFDDEKDAARAFNKVMMERFNPREGWRITNKRMNEATPPPPQRMVGYEPPEGGDLLEMSEKTWHFADGRLTLNCDLIAQPEAERLLEEHRASIGRVYLYAKESAAVGLRALEAVGNDRMQTLVIDAHDRPHAEQVSCDIGDLAPVLDKLPMLDRLFAVGDMTFSRPLQHTHLVRIAASANPLPELLLEAIAASDTPSLRRVQLGLSTDEPVRDDVLIEALPAMLEAKGEQLRQVAITGQLDVAEVLFSMAAVAEHAPPVVTVVAGVADDELVAEAAVRLLSHAQLKALGLPAGELGEQALERINEALPGGIVETQPLFSSDEYRVERYLKRPPEG